jgi:hypothetical protein
MPLYWNCVLSETVFPSEKGGGEGRGEIDERVWMDRRRDSTIFLTGVGWGGEDYK